MKSVLFTLGGLGVLSSSMIANSAFADVSTDRVDTYKANKLIPNEVQIATTNSVSSESAGVAVFSPDALSWKSYSNASSAALGKYMDWTREDFEAFFAVPANEAGFEDAWNALSQFGNDHVQGAAISDEDALSVLQNEFNALISQLNCQYSTFPAFPCEGISFDGLSLSYIDFRNCTGLTGTQLATASDLYFCTLPDVDFTGADLSGIGVGGVDFSKCTNLTASQLLSANSFLYAKLPSVDFTGADLSGRSLVGIDLSKCTNLTAAQLLSAYDIYGAKLPSVDFTGANLAGKDLMRVDFTQCTGLTGTQLAAARHITYIYLTQAQYDAMKADLPSGKIIYVDGKRTTIP